MRHLFLVNSQITIVLTGLSNQLDQMHLRTVLKTGKIAQEDIKVKENEKLQYNNYKKQAHVAKTWSNIKTEQRVAVLAKSFDLLRQ